MGADLQPWTEVLVDTPSGTIRGMITSTHEDGRYWVSPLRHKDGEVAVPNGRWARAQDLRVVEEVKREG